MCVSVYCFTSLFTLSYILPYCIDPVLIIRQCQKASSRQETNKSCLYLTHLTWNPIHLSFQKITNLFKCQTEACDSHDHTSGEEMGP